MNYENVINTAVTRIECGDILFSDSDKMFWSQEGYFLAISFLYNISILCTTLQLAYGWKK